MSNTAAGMDGNASNSPIMSGTFLVKPIVYGNNARRFGAAREDGHTHQWTVYVRPYNNEDITAYVKKVTFKLHESYQTPTRICTEPPFKVTETGWGEFEVVIKIFLHDAPDSRPVTITHPLKLFHPPPHTSDYLVSESYDEIVFGDPPEDVYARWEAARKLPPQIFEPFETNFDAKRRETLELLLKSKNWVRGEIEEHRKRIDLAKAEMSKYKEIIAKREKLEAAEAAAAAAAAASAASSALTSSSTSSTTSSSTTTTTTTTTSTNSLSSPMKTD